MRESRRRTRRGRGSSRGRDPSRRSQDDGSPLWRVLFLGVFRWPSARDRTARDERDAWGGFR